MGKKEKIYSARITRGLSLIKETKTFFQELNNTTNLNEIQNKVLNDNIFDKTALETRKKVFSVIKHRFYLNSKINTGILQKIINSNLNDNIKNLIIYYYFSKSESIVYDITTKALYNMFFDGKSIVTKKDIQTFLDNQTKTHPEINKWTESTKERIVQHYLAIMKDFKFLKGSQKKQFDVPFIPTEILLFILFEKLDKNRNIKQIINSDDFKLFFLEKNDLIHYFEDDKNIQQELEEYVVTDKIADNLTTFFEKFNETALNERKDIGVWISGFFGSGKSHFGKIGLGKIWLIVTSQERLDQVIESVKKKEESYKKIMDRFDTKLHLTSENIVEVLEKRILKKKEAAIPEISLLYSNYQGTISYASKIEGSNREHVGCNEDNFITSYPFLPYQLEITQEIFSNIRRDGVTV